MNALLSTIQALQNWQTSLPAITTESDALNVPIYGSKVHSTFTALPGIHKAACSPPTPVSQLDNYLNTVKSYSNKIATKVNSLTVYNIDMAVFANDVNDYMSYVKSISKTFCVGPSNGVAYDILDVIIKRTNILVNKGVATFETNLRLFYQKALPLLQGIIEASNSITQSSRDYSQVSTAVERYNNFTDPYSIDIWILSPGIQQVADVFNAQSDQAARASNIALFQIQVNVESEARIIVQQSEFAKAALKHWETEDGKEGYQRYVDLVHYVESQLIPAFSSFIEKVPITARVQAALKSGGDAVTYIVQNFNAFPKFKALPASSDSFPYIRYGNDERKFGEDSIVAILQRACFQYFEDTGFKLYIGDMQLEHGGRFGTHVSHKEGKDADVDVFEAGNVPSHERIIALSAAKLFLSVGARLVFYADQGIVNSANEWAVQNSVVGRLVYEPNHTRHFHLRAGL